MVSLTIKNCKTFTLDLEWDYAKDPIFTEWIYLNIVNISDLVIFPFINSSKRSCLPQHVVFKNVNMTSLKFPNISKECLFKSHFKSLTLTKVLIKEKKLDVAPYPDLKVLVMDEVNIEQGIIAFMLRNRNGSIKITNSHFKTRAGCFLQGTVSEVSVERIRLIIIITV